LFTTAADILSWYTSEPSGATRPDAGFFPIHDINIFYIVLIQANPSLEGSLNKKNSRTPFLLVIS